MIVKSRDCIKKIACSPAKHGQRGVVTLLQQRGYDGFLENDELLEDKESAPIVCIIYYDRRPGSSQRGYNRSLGLSPPSVIL